MSYKIRVSKAGYNVLTETDVNNIVYDSDYDTLKYYTSGDKTLSISSGSDEGETDVTHSLGYKPFFVAYLELDFNLGAGNWTQIPFNTADAGIEIHIMAFANTSVLRFGAYNLDDTFGDIDFNFKYKIFRNNTGI